MASKIVTDLAPDDPVVINSVYSPSVVDRRKIDDQNRGVQRHLTESVLRGQQCTYFKFLVDAMPGDVLCSAAVDSDENDAAKSTRFVTRATTATLAAANAVIGIASGITKAGAFGRVVTGGMVGRATTGLGTGTARLVRVNQTSGRPEAVSSPTAGDFLLGSVDTAGNLSIAFSVANTATGTPASYAGSSLTSLAVSTGAKTFTTQAGLAYVIGSRVRLAYALNSANFIEGRVTAYSGTSMTAQVDLIGGSGTYANWNLTLAGEPGAAGSSGGGSGMTQADIVLTASNDSHSGTAIRDGATVTVGVTRILDVGNSDATLRGLWLANAGAWTRPADYDADADIITGSEVFVTQGTLGAGTTWQLTSGSTLAGAKTYERRNVPIPQVRLLIKTNVALSGALTTQSVALANNDLVACIAQSSAFQNGFYRVNTSGAWPRAEFAATSAQMQAISGALVSVKEGTDAGNIFKLVTEAPIILGTTALTFDSGLTPPAVADAGKLAVANSSQRFDYALLLNAHVDPAANIAGSKINPNFGAQNVLTTGWLSLGSAPATVAAGDIGVSLGWRIKGKNGLGTDIDLMRWYDNGGGVYFAEFGAINTGLTRIVGAGSAGIQLTAGTVDSISASNSAVQLGVGVLRFAATVSAGPVISTVNVNSGAGKSFLLRAQGTTAASQNGGATLIEGGRSGSGGLMGPVQIRLNPDDTTPQTMLGIAEVAAGRRAVGLAIGADLNTTLAPADTGDKVVFVGDAATVPTANAGTGAHIYYSDAGRPAWRFNGTTFRMDTTSSTASAGGGIAPPATVVGFLEMTVNGVTGKIPFYAA